MAYEIRINGLDVKCDQFDEIQPLIERESVAIVERCEALSDCIAAIDACMLEMSRNGDSISVRERAAKARARAQRLLGRPVTS